MPSATGFFKQVGLGDALVSVFLVAAAVTIVPALGLLFYLLNRYEGYFEDARVFFALVVGFFVGLVVAFLETVAFRFDSPDFIAAAGAGTAFLFYIGGYALVESAAKTAVVGTAKFRKRKDTPYYGAALGIGFGAMVALQVVAARFQTIGEIGWAWDTQTVVVVALTMAFAAASLLVQASSGILVGRGAAEGRLWRGMAHGALAQMPLFAFTWFGTVDRVAFIAAAAVLGLGYGIALVAWTQGILDRIVPPEIRDMVQKERRREARKRDAPDPPSDSPDQGSNDAPGR